MKSSTRRVRRWRQRGRETGRCAFCTKPAVPGRSCCAAHLLRRMAHRFFGTVTRWTELRDLLEAQQHQCAYTGEPIQIGVNASIDHKVPRSKGGTDEIGNLQWVTATVNRVKTDLTHGELVALCAVIVERHPVNDSGEGAA